MFPGGARDYLFVKTKQLAPRQISGRYSSIENTGGVSSRFPSKHSVCVAAYSKNCHLCLNVVSTDLVAINPHVVYFLLPERLMCLHCLRPVSLLTT